PAVDWCSMHGRQQPRGQNSKWLFLQRRGVVRAGAFQWELTAGANSRMLRPFRGSRISSTLSIPRQGAAPGSGPVPAAILPALLLVKATEDAQRTYCTWYTTST